MSGLSCNYILGHEEESKRNILAIISALMQVDELVIIFVALMGYLIYHYHEGWTHSVTFL